MFPPDFLAIRHGLVAAGVFLALLTAGGCSRSGPPHETERHEGPKVNIADFIAHPSAYKGKTITLKLKINEAINRSAGESLRSYAGRDVKFLLAGPKGERADLIVKISEGLSAPEVGQGDEIRVTFLCATGSLRAGNEAKALELP